MIVLAGADLVLPDRILTRASLVIDGDRIVAIESRDRVDPAGATIIDAHDRYVVPGFVDVHVHGVEGHDALDDGNAVATIAATLPRYGVTAFCPTTIACAPAMLDTMLASVRAARVSPQPSSARVLPAHLESNFINPEFRGAQPLECLRVPPPQLTLRPTETGESRAGRNSRPPNVGRNFSSGNDGDFTGNDILDVIDAHRADVGIVTVAPELPAGMDLVRRLVINGHHVSIGHSGATFEEANAAVDAGVRQATHLFNRMSPLSHRAPGVAGAVLSRDEVVAELVCDGFHVHPAVCGVAIAAKGTSGIMAITDGTAGSGLPAGARARIGGRELQIREAAFLSDGTIAGSVLTMDRAFRTIVTQFGASIVDAALMCATTPSRQLNLTGLGVIAVGSVADLAVLDRAFRVRHTLIGGREVYTSGSTA